MKKLLAILMLVVLVHPVFAFDEDFETDLSAWVSDGWVRTNEAAHSGSWCVTESPGGNYGNLQYKTIEMAVGEDLTGNRGALLSFWVRYDTEWAFDFWYVDLSYDGGVNWSELGQYSGEDNLTWTEMVFDIGGYFRFDDVRIRFVFDSDQALTENGVWIDDVSITLTDTDISPPLALHTPVPEDSAIAHDYEAMFTVYDTTGTDYVNLFYYVETGLATSREMQAQLDRVEDDDWYFIIPAYSPGWKVTYRVETGDLVDPANKGGFGPWEYYTGTMLVYDNGVDDNDHIYTLSNNRSFAEHFTINPALWDSTYLASLLFRWYRDPNRHLDSVDVSVWSDDGGGLPDAVLIPEFGVYPSNTLDTPYELTHMNVRGYELEVPNDFHGGYSYRSSRPYILGDDENDEQRTSRYQNGNWTAFNRDLHLRSIVGDIYAYLPEPPGAFALSSPADGSVQNSGDVIVSWGPAIDPDQNDIPQYVIEWSVNADFSASQTDTTFALAYMISGLNDDETYYWRVKAIDSFWYETYATPGVGGWSFDIYIPDVPNAFDLSAPADGFISPTYTVDLEWNAATDPDPGDAITYWVWWATDAAFTQDLDSVQVLAGTTVTTPALEDDHTYWWKVRAQDTNTLGTWSSSTWTVSIYVEEPPDAFNLLSPADESIMNNLAVDLEWEATTDPDGDGVTYDVYVSTVEGDLGNLEATGLGVTNFTFNAADDTDYWWTVQASDGNGNFTQADQTWKFSTYIEESPPAFSLNSPADGFISPVVDVDLVWNAAPDPDPGDSTVYDVYVSTDPGDLGLPVATDIDGLTYTFTGLDDTQYWWTVVAKDTHGNTTPANETWSFSIYVEEPPDAFSLLDPPDGSISTTLAVDLSWEATTDPDGDDITYDVYVSTVEGDLGNLEATGLDVTNFTFNGVDDTQYWWTVQATDGNGNFTQANETWDFTTDFEDSPDPFNLVSPADGFISLVLAVDLTWEATTDADGDPIRYDLYVSTDPGDLGLPIATDLAVTSYTYNGLDNTQYWWTVIANDGNGMETPANQTWSFTVNLQEPPGGFNLLSPVDDNIEPALAVDLDWEDSIDPDGDPVTYDVYVSTDPGDLGVPVATGVAVSDYTFNGADDTQYWWSIVASDGFGNDTWANQTWTFTISVDEPPAGFDLASPADGTISAVGTLTLTWTPSIDPDGDPVTYDVYVSTDPGDLGLPIATGVAGTSYDFTGLDDTQYWWSIFATDGTTQVQANQTWSFSIDIEDIPGAFNLLTPASGFVSPALDVVLTWEESIDPDGDPVTYDVYVSTDPGDLGLPVAEDIAVLTYTYTGLDDTQYWWTIKAEDDTGSEVWANQTWSFSIYIQEPPSAFSLDSPVDGNIETAAAVNLTWDVSTDPDPGDAVTYDVYVSTNPGDLGLPVVTGLNVTSYTFTGADNTQYWWTVVARDGGGNSTPANETWDFTILIEEPPGPFDLANPANGFVSPVADLTLTWFAAVDPEGDPVTYDVYVSTDPGDLGLPVATDLVATSYDFTGVDNTQYWWTVVADDGNGGITPAASTWSFTILINDIPGAFNLLTPASGTVSADLDVTLTWEESVDPEADPVTYDVYVTTDPGDLGLPVAEDLAVLTYTHTGLDDTQYWWTIKAEDDTGSEVWANQTWSFSIAVEQAPLPFSLESPPDETVSPTADVVLTWNATTDPDPGDNVVYDLYVSTDEFNLGVPVATDLVGTAYTYTGVDDTEYWWTVIAKDNDGDETQADETWSFSIYIEEPPAAFTLDSPADGAISPTADVTLTWNPAIDPDPGDNIVYDVYVSIDPGDLGLPVGTDIANTFYTYNGNDDTQYWWTVHARDSQGNEIAADDTWSFSIYVEEPPDAFSLLSPLDGTVLPVLSADLMWRSAIDPDGDVVSYNVYVSTDPGDLGLPIATGLADTTYNFIGADDTQYWWTIEADDGNGNLTQATQTWSFTIFEENPPEDFSLLTPVDGFISPVLAVDLTWEVSNDPDPGDEVSYDVYVSTDPGDLGLPVATDLDVTNYTYNADDDTQYWWSVIAHDTQGNSTPALDTLSFSVYVEEPPQAFDLVAPADLTVSSVLDVNLTWSPSIDPDGDDVTYELYVSTDPGDLGLPIVTGLDVTSYTFTGADDTQYWWTVEANDGNGNLTPANQTWTFSVAIEEAPLPFSLTSPVDGFISPSLDVDLNWNATTDPDGDDVVYDVYVSTDPGDLGVPVVTDLDVNTYTFTGIDEIQYFWSVAARDDNDNETWALETWSFDIYVEESPGAFDLASPADEYISAILDVTLTWTPSIDPDGDDVTYDVYVSTDPGDLGVPIITDLTELSYTFTGEDGTEYYWSIFADDGNGNQTQANQTWSFSISVGGVNGAFSLLSPESGFISDVTDISLVWETSVDPGWLPVLYDVYVTTDPGDLGDPVATGLTDTSYVFTGTDDSQYWWSVRANDGDVNELWANQTWSFSIYIEESPMAFGLQSPDDEYISPSASVTLIWDEAVDPDPGDEVTYDIYVSEDEGDLGDPVASDLNVTTFTFAGDDNTEYFWTVLATDLSANETWADETRSFSIEVEEGPGLFDLASPANGHVSPITELTLTWTPSIDPDGGDIAYDVYVSTDPLDLGDPVATDLDITSYTFTGVDNEQYWWTVVAIDEGGLETQANQVWTFSIFVQEIPGAFDLASPLSGTVLGAEDVELVWYQSIDPEGDPVTYDVYVTTNPADLGLPVMEDLADTSYTFAGDDDTQYWWTIMADDGTGSEVWANQVWTFEIYVVEPPAVFDLVTPLDESIVDTLAIDLTWDSSIDPDPDDAVVYDVYVSTDEFNMGLPIAIGLTDTNYTYLADDDTEYWWTIHARDTQFNETPAAETWSFEVYVIHPPFEFSLLSPEDNSSCSTGDTTLTWEATTDPDPDDALDSYVVWWATDETFTDNLDSAIVASDQTDYLLENMLDNFAYYWKVRAQDGNSEGRWSTETWHVNSVIPDPPGPFSLVAPEDSAVVDDDTVTVNWTRSIDTDINDVVTYTVEWSADPDFTEFFTGTTTDTFFVITDLADAAALAGLGGDDEFGLIDGGNSDNKTITGMFSLGSNTSNRGFGELDDSPGDDKNSDELDELPDDITIYWRVYATDTFNFVTWSDQGTDGWLFEIYVPDAPEAFSLLSPADGSVCATGDTTLTWSYSDDPDPDDNVNSYMVWWSFDEAFVEADSIEVDTLAGNMLELNDLADDSTYWWKVRAVDGNTDGQWSDETWSFDVYIPEAPEAFTLAAPGDDETVDMDTVTVSWNPAIDPDPDDTVNYEVQWSTDSTFATYFSDTTTDTFFAITDLENPELLMGSDPGHGKDRNSKISRRETSFTDFGKTSRNRSSRITGNNGKDHIKASTSNNGRNSGRTKTINKLQDPEENRLSGKNRSPVPGSVGIPNNELDELPDDIVVYWRVRAVDDFDLYSWSNGDSTDAWAFNIYIADAPSAFNLAGPEDGSTCWSGDTTLTWDASTDPDPDDVLGYVVWWSNTETFDEADSSTVTDIEFELTGLDDDQTYWWRVRAQDSNTAGTWSDETWSLDVFIPDAPDAFALLAPEDSMELTFDEVTLEWSESADQDPGDEFAYIVEWSTSAEFHADSTLVDTTDETEMLISDLENTFGYGATIYWRVHAFDTFDLHTYASPGEDGWMFTIQPARPPEAFTLVSPLNESVLNDTTAWLFEWQETVDPDFGDEIEYVLEISFDEEFTATTTYPAFDSTSIEIVGLFDNTDYWWRVHAVDTNTDGTYSDDVWTFRTAMPQPPTPFALLEPADEDTIGVDEIEILSTSWENSIDPDPEEETSYSVEFRITMGTDYDSTVSFSGLAEPAYVFDLDRVLEMNYWREYIHVEWYSVAISAGDTVECNEHFDFYVEPRRPDAVLPTSYSIVATYPNPFNASTVVVVGLPEQSDLKMNVYNAMGRKVATLTRGSYQAGYHRIPFDATGLASGVYFIRANVPGRMSSLKRVVLIN